MALHEQGMKTKEIAKRVGLGVRTVQRWLTDGAYVETNYHHRHRSSFDVYEADVRRRWDEGDHNIQHIWREIKAQGYPHSDRALRRHAGSGAWKNASRVGRSRHPGSLFGKAGRLVLCAPL